MAKKKSTTKKKKSTYELKTKENEGSVEEFLASVENTKRREDGFEVLRIMKEVTNEDPKMWGDSIVGFGKYHYRTKSGIESDWLTTGFSPRKQSLTIYIMDGFENYENLLSKLGKYKTGKSCLYINKLEDVKIPILKKIISESVKNVKENY